MLIDWAPPPLSVHQQEAVKGFDMLFSTRVPLNLYLVFEVIHRDHVHHDDVVGEGSKPPETHGTMWKHSPETYEQTFTPDSRRLS